METLQVPDHKVTFQPHRVGSRRTLTRSGDTVGPLIMGLILDIVWMTFKGDSVYHMCRMENSVASPTPGSMAVPQEDVVKPAGHLSESVRLSRHRENRTRSPRRHQKGTKLQRRMGDQEQLSWDTDQWRLPGQREHLESSGSTSEPMEISPKR